MNPAQLEANLLSSVRTAADVRLCEELGITADSFTADDNHARVWSYIVEHIRRQRGEAPSPNDLQSLFGFEATESGDLEKYVERVRERQVISETRQALWHRGAELDSNPGESISGLINDLSQLRLGRVQRQSYLDRDALGRLKVFDEMKEAREAGRFIGMPTGLALLDSNGVGLRPGQLVVVLGNTEVGKSWLIMRMAVEAWAAGKKILLISPEMTKDEQGARFDVIVACLLKHSELSNVGITQGSEDRAKYVKHLESLTDRAHFVCIDSSEEARSLTFDEVWSLTSEHRPDEVVIDGLHLLGSKSRSKAGWEILKEGTELLKAMALRERVVVLAAHQADRSAGREGTKPPGLSQISYGYSIGQTADEVISLAYDKKDESKRIYIVKKLRSGQKVRVRRRLHFDVDTGFIEETGETEEDHDELPPLETPKY